VIKKLTVLGFVVLVLSAGALKAETTQDVTLAAYKNRAFKNPFIKVYAGPFNATVVRVYDADTVIVDVYPWPSISVRTKVRIRGIDTPERRRYKCPEEKQLARISTDYVKGLLPKGTRVQLGGVSFGKYAGRVLGNLMISSFDNKWSSLGEILLAAGYAKPYNGGKKKRVVRMSEENESFRLTIEEFETLVISVQGEIRTGKEKATGPYPLVLSWDPKAVVLSRKDGELKVELEVEFEPLPVLKNI
jgi:endonuclease YncB( thermonuclease family)